MRQSRPTLCWTAPIKRAAFWHRIIFSLLWPFTWWCHLMSRSKTSLSFAMMTLCLMLTFRSLPRSFHQQTLVFPSLLGDRLPLLHRQLLSSGQVLFRLCPSWNGVPRNESITLEVLLPAQKIHVCVLPLLSWTLIRTIKSNRSDFETLFCKSLILRLSKLPFLSKALFLYMQNVALKLMGGLN
jgi:hypothetical protein